MIANWHRELKSVESPNVSHAERVHLIDEIVGPQIYAYIIGAKAGEAEDGTAMEAKQRGQVKKKPSRAKHLQPKVDSKKKPSGRIQPPKVFNLSKKAAEMVMKRPAAHALK